MKSSYEKEKDQFRIERHDLSYAGFTLKAIERHGKHEGWALPGGGFIRASNLSKAREVVKQLGIAHSGEKTPAKVLAAAQKRWAVAKHA